MHERVRLQSSPTVLSAALCAWLIASCSSSPRATDRPAAAPEDAPPIATLERVDHLIDARETHIGGLWRLTRGGENAEGYFNFAGDRIVLQRRDRKGGIECDRIYATGAPGEGLLPISNGRGVTTCAYFLPGDTHVIYASTQHGMDGCPHKPDTGGVYAWMLFPEFELYTHELATGVERRLTDSHGYDAEATVSPLGDRIVFTSTRSGDSELWTCALDGSGLFQVTRELGYDGGAFFSHDGRSLVYRTTRFAPEGTPEGEAERATYRDLLARHMVQPGRMDIYVIGTDGSGRRRLTDLPGASFAPYFYPDDRRVIFSTNHHEKEARNFDLYAIGVDGQDLERITWYAGFDSFPMFSRDGRWLVFASNRGGTDGETNLFLARYE